ncbi:hypothetical protein BDA99DRAFT_535735 [Phascolomyces articulosus]|uniref:Uncharacterized protein n=1 Tax=Phascolomyces articulosus TaxID=60185 RepID=A0AAD5KIZ9_9FUNG|nr:hypothetical protein BDA99DRAFT_535735 [Phascolomyces articulosus]
MFYFVTLYPWTKPIFDMNIFITHHTDFQGLKIIVICTQNSIKTWQSYYFRVHHCYFSSNYGFYLCYIPLYIIFPKAPFQYHRKERRSCTKKLLYYFLELDIPHLIRRYRATQNRRITRYLLDETDEPEA